MIAMTLCASVYMCLVVTCWERADLLALVGGICVRSHRHVLNICDLVFYSNVITLILNLRSN